MFKVESINLNHKWFSLYDKVFLEKNLRKAFFEVKKNKGAGEVDRVSLWQYQENLDSNIRELSRTLQQKTYQPLPVRRVLIPKPDGKLRPLGIPAIRDRVVQQAFLNILQPIFEKIFHCSSYGYRPNCSPHQAVRKIEEYLTQGYQWIVDADIEDFFGTLDHELLIDELNTQIADGSILNLVRQFLEAGIMEEGKVVYQTTGTPQGGVISPLLSNIYLNSFDWQIAKAGYKLIRYCDDWIILTKIREEAEKAKQLAEDLLRERKLRLNFQKTRIVSHQEGFEFLGFWFKDYDGIHRKGPRSRATKSFKEKITYLTRRQQPRNVKMVIEKLNPIIRGWGLYFCIGDVKGKFQDLDGWIRMRLRSFQMKKRALSLKASLSYPNQYFRDLGLCFLSDLSIPSFPAKGQRYR